MRNIYPIGDSHIKALIELRPDVFKNCNTDIVVAVYESKSAYAVGTDGHDWYLNEKLKIIPDGEVVILSFGEIDCRHYVPSKSHELGITIEEAVNEVVLRYTENCVRLLKQKFRVAIIGAYMCPNDVHHYKNSYVDILEAKTFFNKKMKIYCEQNGLLYVPLFELGLEGGWHFDQEKYFSDTSHLGEIMIPIIISYVNDFKWKNFDL